MRRQALCFPKVPVGQVAPGRRYIYGEVLLGDLKEAFWSGTHVWTAKEYRQQWVAAAKQCLTARVPVVFYTNVGGRASTGYLVVPTATGLLIFEQLFRPRPHL